MPSPGVLIMDAASRARALDVEKAQAKDVEVKGGREVGLEELIHDGKNKREKRGEYPFECIDRKEDES